MTDRATTDAELLAMMSELNGNPSIDNADSPRFPLLTVDDLRKLPEPTFLIDGWVPERGLTVVFGASGSFKSFVALDYALSVASGKPWQGCGVKRGPVVYLALEGGWGLYRRVDAWMQDNPQADVGDSFRAATVPFDATSSDDVLNLIADVRDQLTETPILVIIDTVARALPTGDENGSLDMGALVVAADQLVREFSGAVLLVHHTGHGNSDRERGHSSLPAATDARICVRRPAKLGLACEVSNPKQKDWKEADTIRLEGRAVGDSLVFDFGGTALTVEEVTRPDRSEELRQEAITAALTASATPLSTNAIKKALLGTGVGGAEAIMDTLRRMVEAGDIAREKSGNAFLHSLAVADPQALDVEVATSD